MSPRCNATLDDFRTRYDVNDLFDFHEALDLANALDDEATKK